MLRAVTRGQVVSGSGLHKFFFRMTCDEGLRLERCRPPLPTRSCSPLPLPLCESDGLWHTTQKEHLAVSHLDRSPRLERDMQLRGASSLVGSSLCYSAVVWPCTYSSSLSTSCTHDESYALAICLESSTPDSAPVLARVRSPSSSPALAWSAAIQSPDRHPLSSTSKYLLRGSAPAAESPAACQARRRRRA